MTFLRQYGEPILRRWKVIVAVLLLSVIGTVLWTVVKGGTSWTATTALTTQSLTRAPEQDAVLALGYVDYFNQPTYQQVLRAEARIPVDVTLKAETGAASPIVYIEAKSLSQSAARSAAQAAADAFRVDIRNGLDTERQRQIDELQKTVDAAVVEVQKPTTTDAERNVILDQIRSLQGRIADIASDGTNELKPLQTEPGVASSVPAPGLAIAGGAFGGLVFGVLLAWVLALLDGRIRSRRDAMNVGATVLGELAADDDRVTRGRLVEHMVNGLRARGGKLPSTVAVVGVGKGDGARFATELLTAAAPSRSRAVLVRADLRDGDDRSGSGLVDVLDGSLSLDAALTERHDGWDVLPTGRLDGRDAYRLMDADRVADLVADLADRAGLVVFETSPLQAAPETQVVCAAVDSVILVVRRGTRRKQLRVAQEMLAAVDAPLAGVVIDAAPDRVEASEPERTEIAARVPIPEGPSAPETSSETPASFWTAEEPSVEAPTVAVAEKAYGADSGRIDLRADGMADERRRPSPFPRPRSSVLSSSSSNGQHPDSE